jgi:uncharacterized protein YoxC
MSEEVFDEKALESETAIRDAGEVKVQEKAVSEATNEIEGTATQAGIDNVKAEEAKLNNIGANATERVFREGGIDNVTTEDLNNLNDKVDPILRAGGGIGDNAPAINDIRRSTDPSVAKTRDAFEKAFNASGKILGERFSKSLESKHPELKKQFDKITSETQDIGNKMRDEFNKPTPDTKVLNDLQKELDAKQKEFEKLFEKADKISDEVESKKDGIDYSKYLFYLSILGGILGGILTGIILAKALTGCYVYYGGGLSNKLEGCSDYYNIDIDHQIQCRCGKSVDSPIPVTSQLCDTLDQSECTTPYCLGFCSKATYTPVPLPCEFPMGKNLNSRGLQCTTTATGDNYVYYGYKKVTLLSLVSGAVNAIQNAPTYAEDFMKQMFMYFLYGIGAIFLLGVVMLFLKFAFSKLTESKPEVQNAPAPAAPTPATPTPAAPTPAAPATAATAAPAPVINTNPEALH